MATIFHHPSPVPPVAAVARILGRFERDQLAGFIEVAIELLDVLDGDPDQEPEEDACAAYDDDVQGAFVPRDGLPGDASDAEEDDEDCGLDEGEPDFRHRPGYGPGCDISDPGGCEHDGRETEDGL